MAVRRSRRPGKLAARLSPSKRREGRSVTSKGGRLTKGALLSFHRAGNKWSQNSRDGFCLAKRMARSRMAAIAFFRISTTLANLSYRRDGGPEVVIFPVGMNMKKLT